MARIPGMVPMSKLVLAGFETLRAKLRREVATPPPPVADAPRADEIPSVAELGAGDRVLAEIDQDGFAFAVHPADEPYFNRRPEKLRKRRYKLDIVLRRGAVCVRKSFLRQDELASRGTKLWGRLGLLFYTEAAALLRLEDLGCAPRLQDIQFASQTVFMDYIHGQTLQRRLSELTVGLTDLDAASTGVDDTDREQREHAAFEEHADDQLRESLAKMIQSMNDRGVAPMDVKLGNVVKGARTGSLYWIDFELAALRGLPGYAEQLAEHHRRVEQWFGLSL